MSSVSTVLQPLSWVLAATAVLLGCATFVSLRRLGPALGVFLDLLLASGLLRLSADAPWRALATAALLVLLRKLVVHGVAAGQGAAVHLRGPLHRAGPT